ncbi:MAG: sialidase family protein [Bacteroidota bacterium]
MKKFILLLLVFFTTNVFAQFEENNWISQALPWRNIGPANMMGRIAAVEAHPDDYRHVLMASASGGVYKSTNAGITWKVIFDKYGANSIGSVAMYNPNPDIIWIGTGESANRNSSGWGNGLFKSTDGGETFDYVGLKETHHIAEIALHPTDPNIAYIAAVGHLWGYGGERGLYKTIDGGKSWEKLTKGLPEDGKTGCTEIIMHPDDPNTLFAGFYHRLRTPYFYTSGGEQGGLFKSTDGGKSWRKLTQGLPTGETGMIDIDIQAKNPDIMVAAIEADENLPEGVSGSGVYRSDDGGESWQFLLKHAVRPFYHGQICIDPLDDDNIYVVSRDARNSIDGGKTFQVREWRADGGDDHDMWISPKDPKIIYLATDQGLKLSNDRGKTWLSLNNTAIGQYYAIGVDMRDPYWVGGGLQDNGLWMTPSNSREYRGILNMHSTWIGEGDGFHTQIDPTDYRTIYMVNHVGFACRLNFDTREYEYITPTPETVVNFGDFVDLASQEEAIDYTIDPGEHWFFYERANRAKLPPQFRFNWSSPLVMSRKNPHTIYFGGNYLFKSVDQGKSWRIISPDLTKNDPQWRNPSNSGYLTRSVTGGENHYTIITISESPVNDQVLWAGTDDGNLQVTLNGGQSWENVKVKMPAVPADAWVSRVEASRFEAGTCYVTFDNHRYDDFKAYVYKTEDYGQTWKIINNGIIDGYSAYVIKEDVEKAGLLFAGTENAVYASIDDGENWLALMNNMPTVAVHDLVVHPRDGDLIAGTHGRSLWICDDIGVIRGLDKANLDKDIVVLNGQVGTKWRRLNTGRKQPAFMFRGRNPPAGVGINFYIKEKGPDTAMITIKDIAEAHQFQFNTTVEQGLNRARWQFYFAPNESEVKAYEQGLLHALVLLEPRVKSADLKNELDGLRREITGEKDFQVLNEIREKMVDQFSSYADGKTLFGPQLGWLTAPAGQYKVEIKYRDQTATGVIEVREDPMLEQKGW